VSARNAIIFTVLFVVLLPVYIIFGPQKLKPSALQEHQESLLKLSGIDSITVTRTAAGGTESLKYHKTADGKLFQLVEPPNAFMPQDLMQAMAALLLNAKQVEVVAQNTHDLAEFGLDHPQTEMTIVAPGKPQPIKIYFGAENPTRTAIYAQIEGVPKVFLLGRNLEYYQTLMFQWIEGKQGKNA
jgi:Domain of unknown function (DUF4340)